MFDSIRQNAQLRSKVLTYNPLLEKLYKDFENSVFSNRFVNTKAQTMATLGAAEQAIKQRALDEARRAELFSAFMDEYAQQSKFRKEIVKPEHIYSGMISRGFQDVGDIAPEIRNLIIRSNKKKISPILSSNPNALKIKANLMAAQEKSLAAQDMAEAYSTADRQLAKLMEKARGVNFSPSPVGPRINIMKFRENMKRMNEMKNQLKNSSASDILMSLLLKKSQYSRLETLVNAKLKKMASDDEFGIVPSGDKYDKSLSYDVGTTKIYRRRNLDLSDHVTKKIKDILSRSNYTFFPGFSKPERDESKDLYAVLAELKADV